MAENANQGIMSLSEMDTENEGQGQVDLSLFRPEITSYARSNPVEFGENVLQGMEQGDPELIRQFRQVLAQAALPSDVIDALGQMIDAILNEPENYDEARQILLEEGVPEDFLPEQFDLAFFTAFNIALDQISTAMPRDAMAEDEFEPFPINRAEGGIATMKPMADAIARMGRNGDTMLAHVTPSEARMLRRRGGSGTINPYTGLPEFFFKKIFKAIGKVVKKVVSTVTKVVKTVVKGVVNVVKKVAKSPLGKIALTAAGVFALGPAGLNLAGGVGSLFGFSMTPALAMGINTFAANTVVNLASGQKLGEAVKNGAIAGVLTGGVSKLTGWAPESYKTAYGEPLTDVNSLMPSDIAARASGDGAATSSLGKGAMSMKGGAESLYTPQSDLNISYGDVLSGGGGGGGGSLSLSATGGGEGGGFLSGIGDFVSKYKTPLLLGGGALLAANALGGGKGFFEETPAEVPEGWEPLAKGPGKTGVDLYNENPEAYSLNMEGRGLLDAGEYVPPPPDRERDPYTGYASGGYVQNYTIGGPAFPETPLSYSPNEMSAYGGVPMQQQYSPFGFANGGNVPDPRNPDNYPRRTGAIAGPGTPTSDSIPAMLSDGEFVFTKKAVDGAARLASGGTASSPRKTRQDGAREMYSLMKTLEGIA